MASKFGQLLLWGNLITPEQLDEALALQRRTGGKIGEILIKLGYVTDDDVTRTVGMKYGVPTVNLARLAPEKDALELLSPELARSLRVLPISRAGTALTCALEDPTRLDIVDQVEFQTGNHVQPVLVTTAMMDEALERYYSPRFGSGAAAPLPARVPARPGTLGEIHRLLERLSPEKLEYVRKFLVSIQSP